MINLKEQRDHALIRYANFEAQSCIQTRQSWFHQRLVDQEAKLHELKASF